MTAFIEPIEKDASTQKAEAANQTNPIRKMKTTPTKAPHAPSTPRWGASPVDWAHFVAQGRVEDLLPVVSNPKSTISQRSMMTALGKTPSHFNNDREVVGITRWTSTRTTEKEVDRWSADGDLGICVQTRAWRAIDVDISDPVRAAEVQELVEMSCGNMHLRSRENSGKRLLVFHYEGDLTKRVIRTRDGLVELLATGQQFVAVGTHVSGSRYEWPRGLPGAEFPVAELTLSEIDVMWQGLADIFGIEHSEQRTGARPTIPRSHLQMNDDPLVPFLERNGWVESSDSSGRVFVRCPWSDHHTVDTGITSTAYMPRNVGGFLSGAYRCLHAHCVDKNLSAFEAAVGFVATEFDDISGDALDNEEQAAVRARNAAKAQAKTDAAITRARRAKGLAAEVLAHLARLSGKSAAEVRTVVGFDTDKFNAQYLASGWSPDKGQVFIMTPAGKVVRGGAPDAALLLGEHFDHFYDSASWMSLVDGIEGLKDAERKRMHAAPLAYLIGKIKAHRQFTVLNLIVDMFATSGRVELHDGRATLVFPHQPLQGGEIDQKLLSDYREHFDQSPGVPSLDEFIEVLVAARFASNRKRSHVWLQAESDWGKSFLMSVLRKHGLVCETSVAELDKVMAGGPVGLTVEDMRRVWVLAVDEFKGVSREIKQLSHEMTFSPKGMPRVTAPLYLKVFMSAEDVPSLASDETGVEDQFAKRFMHWKASGKLADRKVFTGNSHRYMATLANHVAERVNVLVAKYVAMGAEGASNAAEAVLERVYERFAIGNGFASLSDLLVSLGEQFRAELVDALHRRPHSTLGRLAGDHIFVVQGEYWLRRPQGAFRQWADQMLSKSEAGKVAYKAADVINAMGGTKFVWVGGASAKALPLGPVPTMFDEVAEVDK